MDKATEHSSSTKNFEAAPGPSIEEVIRSSKSRKGVNISASRKRVKNKKNKIGNEKTKAKDKIMGGVFLSDRRRKKASMFPFTRNRVNSMVMDSIKNVGKRHGASLSDIRKYMIEHYKADMELLDTYVKHFLENCVEKGLIVRVKRKTGEEKFKKATKSARLKREMDAMGKALERASSPKSAKPTKRSAGSRPTSSRPTSRSAAGSCPTEAVIPEIHSKDQAAESINMTENLEIMPEPSTKTVAEASNFNERPTTAASNKRARQNDEMSETENIKQKTITNAEVEKVEVVSATETVTSVAETEVVRSLESKVSHPKTSEMVMNAIKSLKKRNGVKLEDIMRHIEENHLVNTRAFRHHVNRFLNKSVEEGILEKLGGAEGRYKIKKLVNKVNKASTKKSTKRKRV